MELDLNTNGNKIRDSIESMNRGQYLWVLLGYTHNRTIDVIETGDDSLEDMFEEFHGSKVMFGFASVLDPNTKLKKNILINWQGSGANHALKTASIQHSIVIKELCKPLHVTITARDDQDLDLKEIMLKVAAASGSNYSYHKQDKSFYENQNIRTSEGNDAESNRKARQQELSQLSRVNKPTYKPVATTAKPSYQPKPFVKPPVTAPKTVASPTKVGTNYQKINPAAELKNLRQTDKVEFVSNPNMRSENNTAEQLRRNREKELESLKSNRRQVDDDNNQIGTVYKKINPMEEIQKLKSAAQNKDKSENDFSTDNTPQYRRINPAEEIQQLRRTSMVNSEDVSDKPQSGNTGTNYQRINPADEIRKARRESVNTEDDNIGSPGTHYQKINPADEIQRARTQQNHDNYNRHPDTGSQPVQVTKINTNVSSARQAFNAAHQQQQQAHGTNNHPKHPPVPKPPQPNQAKIEQEKREIEERRQREAENERRQVEDEERRRRDDERRQTEEMERIRRERDEGERRERENRQREQEQRENQERERQQRERENQERERLQREREIQEREQERLRLEEQQRRERELEEQSRPMPPIDSPNKVESTLTAIGLYEYQANDEDEISFNVNELITEIDQVDEGWWVGVNKQGVRGMFPSNYVELQASNNTHAEQRNDVSQINPVVIDEGRKVKALYAYYAQEADELTMEEGEVIYNVEKIDEGWWKGETINGATGMFPANYVEFC